VFDGEVSRILRIYLGALCLAAGVIALGVGLLTV
jgi:hypothetical protein